MSAAGLGTWYARQTPRDQRVLRIGSIAAAVVAVVAIVVPLQRGLSHAREDVHRSQDDVNWMNSVSPTLVGAGPPAAARPANQSLVVLIANSAAESGLTRSLTATTPSGNGAMRVQLQNADFNLMLGWLHRLSTQQGVRVEDASITAAGPGLVNVSAQLRLGK
jgi:general secretion pathway protein M